MLKQGDPGADVPSENVAKAARGPERKNLEVSFDESQPPSGREKMNMAAEQHPEGPTIFEEISVVLMEEKELAFEPHLLALSGNNIQQYCTMLSWLELKNPKPEIYFQNEQGLTVMLSLAHVVEEFEILPCSSQGDRTLQTSEPESLQQESAAVPLVRLQYNFVPELEGGVLQGKPFSETQQGTGLQARSSSNQPSGENTGIPPEVPARHHPGGEGLVGRLDPSLLQQEGSQEPTAVCFAAATVSQGSERRDGQDVAELSLLLRKEGLHCDGAAQEPTTHPRAGPSPLCGTTREGTNKPLPFQIPPACAGDGSSLGPPEGGKPTLKPNLTAPQLVPAEQHDKGCDGRRPVSFSTASLAAHEKIVTGERQKLCSPLSLQHLPSSAREVVEKAFHCPDCGKGFLHHSSIGRHQSVHHQKSHWGKKRVQGLGDGMGWTGEKPRNRACKQLSFGAVEKPFRCPDCGKTFTVRWSLTRHQVLHQTVRPFGCQHCSKSYTQRSHLNRHQQMKHTTLP